MHQCSCYWGLHCMYHCILNHSFVVPSICVMKNHLPNVSSKNCLRPWWVKALIAGNFIRRNEVLVGIAAGAGLVLCCCWPSGHQDTERWLALAQDEQEELEYFPLNQLRDFNQFWRRQMRDMNVQPKYMHRLICMLHGQEVIMANTNTVSLL